MLLLPHGIAHGFITLEDDTHVLYHHTEFYNSEAERGVNYKDERININWPITATCISERDKHHPFLDKNFKGLEL